MEQSTEKLYTAPKLTAETRDRINTLAGKYGYRRVSDVTRLLLDMEAIITADRRLMNPKELLEFTRKIVEEHDKKVMAKQKAKAAKEEDQTEEEIPA